MPVLSDLRTSGPLQACIVGMWVVAAVCLNVMLFAGCTPPTSRIAESDPHAESVVKQSFPGTGTDAVAYLVAESSSTPASLERGIYHAVVRLLREDTDHVGAVLDWSSNPLTAPMGIGSDGTTTIAVIWLVGQAGSERATDSLAATRSLLNAQLRNYPVRARITAPASAVHSPLPARPWQSALIIMTAVIAFGLSVRKTLQGSAGTRVLLAATLALAVSLPLVVWLKVFLWQEVPTASISALALSVAVSALVVLGTLSTSASLLARTIQTRDASVLAFRQALPALTVPGLSTMLLTGPLLLARTPLLQHDVGVAAVPAAVALVAALALLYTPLDKHDEPFTETGGLGVNVIVTPPHPTGRRAVVATAVLLAVGVLSLGFGVRLTPAGNPNGVPLVADGSMAFRPFYRLPDIVTLKSRADLRDPAGLVAVDQVSRHLMELPGVRKVQSGAWPEGIPWSDASLTHAAGRIGEQLQHLTTALLPQVNSIKSLSSALDQMNSAVDLLHTAVRGGTSGLKDMQQAVKRISAGAANMSQTIHEVSGYLEPVRKWANGIGDCQAEPVCSAALKVVGPFDRIETSAQTLTEGADQIAAGFDRTGRAVESTPRSAEQMQLALATLHPLVHTLQNTVEEIIPEVVQLSAYLKNLSVDFDGTGEGGFYLSRKQLADPTYRDVRDEMFSPDGTTTRLFVYSDVAASDPHLEPPLAQLRAAVVSATKYGSLAESSVSVRGSAAIAASASDALVHDLSMEAAMLLTVSVLIATHYGARRGLVVGIGVVTACVAGLGLPTAFSRYLPAHDMDVGFLVASIAVTAIVGALHLASAEPRPRFAVAVPWLGASVGLALLLEGVISHGPLTQLGICITIGSIALTGVKYSNIATTAQP